MSKQIQNYISCIDEAKRSVNRVRGSQLNSKKIRLDLRNLVEVYFKEIRPVVVEDWEQDDEIKGIDNNMQALLILCHKRGSLGGYKKLLGDIKKLLINVDSRIILTSSPILKNQKIDKIDDLIITTLQSLIPSAALSYQQAIIDLNETDRLSWRGPATDLREVLRETLDFLAPDRDVEGSPGYKQLKDTIGPTMKQKVRFVMKNRGLSKKKSGPAEDAARTIEETVGSFVRSVYTRSSVSAHTPTEKSEILRVRDLVRVVLSELLEIRIQ